MPPSSIVVVFANDVYRVVVVHWAYESAGLPTVPFEDHPLVDVEGARVLECLLALGENLLPLRTVSMTTGSGCGDSASHREVPRLESYLPVRLLESHGAMRSYAANEIRYDPQTFSFAFSDVEQTRQY
jgi:hypothetical protein